MSKSDAKTVDVINANTDQLFDSVFTIRTNVFVDETKVDQEDEYDGFDHLSLHYLALLEGIPAGAGRMRTIQGINRIRLERISVLKSYRREGVGTAIVRKMLGDISGNPEIFVRTPSKNVEFFQKLGFEVEGDEFEEAGIPHYEMLYKRTI